MSIVFSAITPHPPVLIPVIGKANLERIKDTVHSYERLKTDITAKNVETIVIISPHGLVQKDLFTLNLSPGFNCDFEQFGDFSTKKSWKGDVGLSHRIRESMEIGTPMQMVSNPVLDHGSSTPLILLTESLPEVKLIPVYFSGLSLVDHFKFGVDIAKELQRSNKKIAVIASGDLSHRLTKDAPAGYSSKGKKFDKKIIDILQKGDFEEITKIDEEFAFEAGECGLRSIVILLGMINGIKHEAKILSYEAPFGVGYLTVNFEI